MKLGHDLGVAEDQMMQLTQESVQQRTARLLLLLLEGSGRKPEAGTQIKIPFLRKEMADMIGTSSETLIRTLRHFAKRGLIKVQGSQIQLSNLTTLRVIAYGPEHRD